MFLKITLGTFLLGVLALYLSLRAPLHNYVYAATDCASEGRIQSNGLVSAGSTSTGANIATSAQVCVIDPKASFASYKLPSYDELKSVYYTQAKPQVSVTKHSEPTGNNFTASDIPLDGPTNHVYSLPGNLTISGNPTGGRSGAVFIDGNLNINSNLSYGSGATGIVLVAKGNINIDISVTQINAVLISEGVICTAAEGGTCPPEYTNPAGTQTLTINGSLISLSENSTKKIRFRRNLSNNSVPAEKVIQQPKYLVILKDFFTQTLDITTEDTNYSVGL